MLKKLFGFDPKITSIRTELLAGLTTFLTMAYILAVNPDILSATGMDKGAIFTATVLSSAIATFLLAFYAKMPLAQAPSMGINAFFAYTLVIALGYSWQTALAVTFIEGIIFILLTVLNIRDKIIDCIPLSIRYAITVGIGCFIAFIGLKNAGIVVNNEATLVSLGEFTTSTTIASVGILLSGILMYKNVRGALFYSIITCTILAIIFGIVTIPQNFSPVSLPASLEPTFMKFDFSEIFNLDMLTIIFLLTFMDMFNTIGTLVGAAYQANMIDEKGNIPRIKESLMADAIGTSVGAMLGTSTVTTYTESITGIADGGRTGLTAFSTGMLFLLALFFSPLFCIIPNIATTGALVTIGVLMMSCIKNIDFSDLTEAMPCFITIIMMVLTYSIADGMALGLISYTIIKLFSGRHKDIHISLYVITIILIFMLAY